MKNINDYLHLYLPFDIDFHGFNYKIIGFKDCGHFFHLWHEHGFFDILKEDFKLPLRHLSDMTQDEAIEIGLHKVKELWHEDDWGKRQQYIKKAIDLGILIEFTPEEMRKALSKSFDLFRLIKDGLALDATKLKLCPKGCL